MNRALFIISLLFLSFCTSSAQDGRALYLKYRNAGGVEASYISQEMFALFGRLPEIEILDRDVDLTPVVKELKGLYILESKRSRVSKRLRDDLEEIIRNAGYTLIMSDRDDDEETWIYALYNGKLITSLLYCSCEDYHEVDVIFIEGDIMKEDLNRTLNQNKKYYRK